MVGAAVVYTKRFVGPAVIVAFLAALQLDAAAVMVAPLLATGVRLAYQTLTLFAPLAMDLVLVLVGLVTDPASIDVEWKVSVTSPGVFPTFWAVVHSVKVSKKSPLPPAEVNVTDNGDVTFTALLLLSCVWIVIS